MELKPIKTAEDYDMALDRVEELFGAAEGTREGDELEVLLLLVEKYEELHYPIAPPSARAAIEFVMEQRGFIRADLAKLLGAASRASDIMNGKRSVSIKQARILHKEWGVPAESLLAG